MIGICMLKGYIASQNTGVDINKIKYHWYTYIHDKQENRR